MYNYPIAVHLNKKSNAIFYKQLPVFLCFFICLATFFFTFYFLNLLPITALSWLFILFSSVFILFMNRHWASYLLVIVIPFLNLQFLYMLGPEVTQQIFLKPINIVVFIVLCAFFFERMTNKHQQVKRAFPVFHLPIIVLCIWGIISESWTPAGIFGIDMGITFITNASLYFLISYYANSVEALKKIMLCWIGMSVFVAVFMFVSIIPGAKHMETVDIIGNFSMFSFFEMGLMRAEGLTDRSTAAIFISVAVLSAAGLASTTQKTKYKVLLFLAIAFLMFAFFFTQSKAPLAGLLVGVLFITPFIINIRKNLIRYLCYIGISFLLIFGTFFKIIGYLLQYTTAKGGVASRLVSSSAASEAVGDRFEYWSKVFNQLIYNGVYLSGFGIGGSTHYLHPVPHPHNIYISIVCDFGLVGFVVLGAVVFFVCNDVFYIIKKLPASPTRTLLLCIYAGLIVVGVSSLSDFTYSFTLAWALLGLIAAAHKQIRNYTLVHIKT